MNKKNTLETLNKLIIDLDNQISDLNNEKEKLKSKIIWISKNMDHYKQLKIINRDQLCTPEVNSIVDYYEVIPPSLENVSVRFYTVIDDIKIYCDPFDFSLGYIGLDCLELRPSLNNKFIVNKNWQLPCIKAGVNKKVLIDVESNIESIAKIVENHYKQNNFRHFNMEF